MSETPREPQREQSEQTDEDQSGEANNEVKAGKDEVQEQSEESFPASDPPSF